MQCAQDGMWLEANGISHVLNVADELCLDEAVFVAMGIGYSWFHIADRTLLPSSSSKC